MRVNKMFALLPLVGKDKVNLACESARKVIHISVNNMLINLWKNSKEQGWIRRICHLHKLCARQIPFCFQEVIGFNSQMKKESLAGVKQFVIW